MIQVENMTFGYGKERPIFSRLSLTFREKFNAIIGPNASGKSTFLKCLFGLLPAAGKIFYDGQDVKTMSHEKKMARIAYLPQEETKAAGFTVFEAVLLGRLPRLRWKVNDEDTAAVMRVLSLLHLEALAFVPFTRLSGGQQKLVSIAQTLVREPHLVLMDEPTNSLDLQKQLELLRNGAGHQPSPRHHLHYGAARFRAGRPLRRRDLHLRPGGRSLRPRKSHRCHPSRHAAGSVRRGRGSSAGRIGHPHRRRPCLPAIPLRRKSPIRTKNMLNYE